VVVGEDALDRDAARSAGIASIAEAGSFGALEEAGLALAISAR
jgi:hypothetical protein